MRGAGCFEREVEDARLNGQSPDHGSDLERQFGEEVKFGGRRLRLSSAVGRRHVVRFQGWPPKPVIERWRWLEESWNKMESIFECCVENVHQISDSREKQFGFTLSFVSFDPWKATRVRHIS
jgi:hypothetical protein